MFLLIIQVWFIQVIKSSLLELPNLNFELNAIQKRNLAKVINRERSLVDTTVPILAPSIVEEGNISGRFT